jgi:hypothetical protein
MLVIEEERLLRRLWPSACRSPRPRSSAGLLRVSYRRCTSAVPAGSARAVCWRPSASCPRSHRTLGRAEEPSLVVGIVEARRVDGRPCHKLVAYEDTPCW